MNGYINPRLNGQLQDMSILGIANVGDAVFSLMVRTWLCMRGVLTAKRIHDGAVAFVSAKAQSDAAKRILSELRPEELSVFKRGRNARVGSVPRGSTNEEYHMATGIEALFGYLYLSGRTERLEELFEMVTSGGK